MQVPSKIQVVAGLGNPGKKYEFTRHNLGFLVVEAWAEELGWDFKESREFNSKIAKGEIGGNIIQLLLPQTYMNESGRAVRQFLNFYKIPPNHFLVVADDAAIPFGEMRLKRMGSSGGHNGLKSIETHLGTRDYPRLRMGVGDQFGEKSLADYVLSGFNQEESSKLSDFIQKGVAVLGRLMIDSMTQVMNLSNGSQANDLTTRLTHKGRNEEMKDFEK